jgi:hypothetical protein
MHMRECFAIAREHLCLRQAHEHLLARAYTSLFATTTEFPVKRVAFRSSPDETADAPGKRALGHHGRPQ